MALDRGRFESIGKAVPGARQVWRALHGFGQTVRRRHWWKRWVHRDPLEVVTSNTSKAFDFFFAHDRFIETDYLRQARLDSYTYVAEYCSSVATTSDREQNPLKVLDVGCGTGHLLLALSSRFEGRACLYGLDFSRSAVRRSRQTLPTADYVVSSVYNMPYPDGSFDMATCTETLEHLQRPEEALREMFRVLKSAGQLVLTVPDGTKNRWGGHVNFWTAAEFRHLLLPYGVQRVVPVQPDGYLLAHATKLGGSLSLGADSEMPHDVLLPE